MPAPDKRGKNKPRPLGRPKPAKGAARRKKAKAPFSSPLAERLIAGGEKRAGRPAPAFGAARLPKTRAALYARYGLVFDPSSEDDEVTQRELDSLLELYRRSTGGELDRAGDVRKALEDAGLIGKPEKRLTKPAEDLFASATDALDWFDRNVGPYVSDQAILGGIGEGVGDVFGAIGGLPSPIPSLGGLRIDASREGRLSTPSVEQRTIGEDVGGAAGLAAGAVGGTLGAIAQAPSPIPRIGGLRIQPTERGTLATPTTEQPSFLSDVGGAVTQIATGIGRGTEAVGDLPSPIPNVGGLRIQSSTTGRLATPNVEQQSISEMWKAALVDPTLTGVSQRQQEQTIMFALGGIEDREIQAQEFMFLAAAAEGMPASDLNYFRRANKLGPLDAEIRQRLIDAAVANGWDMQDPAKYTDADIAKRAFTSPSAVGETARGVLRQVGEFAAAPMAVPAIVQAIGSGDSQEMEQLLRFMFAPYTGLYEDYQRRGARTALSAFAQEYPLDAILLFNAVLRATGRLGGMAARAGAGTNALGREFFLRTPQEGSLRARLGEYASVGRPIEVRGPSYQRESGRVIGAPEETPATIAFTGKNLLDTALKELYAYGLTIGMRRSGAVGNAARFLAGRRTQRAVRRSENLADDAGNRIAQQITSLVGGLGVDQLTKLALELTAARSVLGGGRYDFGQRADFFAGEARARRELAAEATGSRRRSLRADAARFDRQAAFARQMDETPLSDELVQDIREAVREIGDDNDTIIAVLMDAADGQINPNALQRTEVPIGELRVGDKIDIGFGEDTVPARVINIERTEDGRLKILRQNILDPRDVSSIDALGSQRIIKLRPSVNAAKYVRQFIEWDELINQRAKSLQERVNLQRREEAAEANVPRRRIMVLDKQRRGMRDALETLVEELQEARVAGNAALARRKQKSIQIQTRRLLKKLREMRRLVDAEAARLRRVADDARRASDDPDNDPLVRQAERDADEMGRIAALLEEQQANIVTSRGARGRFATEAGDLVPADEAAVRQAGLLRRLRGGQFSQRNIERVEQPRARELLERAGRGERRAAELRRLEEELLAERAAAPSAAQASRARRAAREAREDVGTLVRESARASRVPEGLAGALDELQARLVYLSDTRWRGAKARAFASSTRADRVAASATIRRLREKANQNRRFTDQDVRDLQAAEVAIRRIENRLEKAAFFRDRPGGLRNTPAGFGEIRVPGAVEDVGVTPRRRLEEAAREREAVAERAEGVVAQREAAPPLRREAGEVDPLRPDSARMTIAEVRRRRREIEREVKKNRAEAIRIIEKNRPRVSDKFLRAITEATEDFRLVIDDAGNTAAFRVMLDKPVFFKIDRARAQTKEEFIAQAELYGDDPVLWLGTRKGVFAPRAEFIRERELDFSSTAGIPQSRLERYRGQVYASGSEDFRRAWQNLLNDTKQIRSALEFQQQIRKLVMLTGVVIRSTTAVEAAALNRARNIDDDATKNIVLSDADSVVFHAKEFVPVRLGKGQRREISVGIRPNADDAPDEIFLKSIDVEEVARAGEDYVLVPKYLYDAMLREIRRIDYRPGDWLGAADRITRQWRNFTLNIFPRTGFANLFGSIMLGIAAGAGPRSFYMAFRYIYNQSVPGPVQLRQRFAMQLTSEASFERTRARLPQRRVTIPGTDLRVSAESPLQGLAWWMNTMRRFNAVSEDFGRLAVWYSRAIPEARRATGESAIPSWIKMRQLTNDMEEMLERFATNDPEYFGLAQRFLDESYEWLGDLHSGGRFNTALRVAIPFQQWYRHILRLTLVTMPLKYPGRTLFLTRLAEIGQDYQREHGVFPPWFVDVMPLFIEEKITEIAGKEFSQKYVAAWRTSNLWPWTTASELVSGEELDAGAYTQQMLTPIWRNMFFIAYSMLGTAKKPGRYSIDEDVKNAYGDTIDTWSMEGMGYILNLLWRMLPGSTMVMGSAGKAEESGFLFRNRKKMIKGPRGPLPEGALPPDTPGRDVLQLREDFTAQNLIALFARMTIGGSLVYVPSEGWVSGSQFASMLNQIESEAGRKRKAKLLQEIDEMYGQNDADFEVRAGETYAEYVRRTSGRDDNEEEE